MGQVRFLLFQLRSLGPAGLVLAAGLTLVACKREKPASEQQAPANTQEGAPAPAEIRAGAPAAEATRPAHPLGNPSLAWELRNLRKVDLHATAPAFRGSVQPLSPEVRAEMTERSWRPGCPVSLDDLSLVKLDHWGFDGRVHSGEIVVAKKVATDVLQVFSELFTARFPLERVQRIDAYDGSDERSMKANNTSGFNCRQTTSGTRWSEHTYGTAIDLNPVQNPYVRGARVEPASGREYVSRAPPLRPGMIAQDDAVTRAFAKIGWSWGGSWTASKDYQHFSLSGR